MTTITIPTTVFVKKIVFAQRNIPLTARTQNCTIQLNEDDELFDLLRYSGTLRKHGKAQALLTEKIHFDLSDTIARHVAKDVYAIGMYLDRAFKRELCKNVEARAKSNTEKVASIREFMAFANIEEDDYSKEAAVKRVQRHFSQKKSGKTAILALSNVGAELPFSRKAVLFTDDELEMFYQTYRKQYPRYFYTSERTERIKLPDQCRTWIYAQIGNRTPQYIAKKFKINAATVWKRAVAFDREFAHRPKPTPCGVLSQTI